MRPKALVKLLRSINLQTLPPDDIVIIDGSINNETTNVLQENKFKNLKYFKVNKEHRGLTKQRNFGLKKVSKTSKIICFLDDDTVLETNYFENLIRTYSEKPDALAVGGYVTNEVLWKPSDEKNLASKFYFDGWMRDNPLRFRVRRMFKLLPDVPVGFMPSFSHGYSVSFLPPTQAIYEIEQLIGCTASFKIEVFERLKFSTYFEGYGLYEDADFSLRVAKLGKLYVNTSAKLEHYHESSGRPNQYKYGKMVVRNGWYVWRVKYPNPGFKARIKFNATSFLLTLIRASNIFSSKEKKKAFTETLGRIIGWFSLIFSKPKLQ